MADARKEKIDAEVAWDLLKAAKKITAAKGKKVQGFDPAKDSKEDILKAVMGPSGNLRAPALKVGDEFVIGFNAELYGERFA